MRQPIYDDCRENFYQEMREFVMIYILEDDDNIRKLVSYALAREGYVV